jgi:two-component system nitrogen regulation response regulator NtrX
MTDILIVDDERDIRELISDILIDEGYKTRLASTSDAAMRQIADERPAMVILDIWLKDSAMDGIDILKSVKANHPDIPVVIISGHGNIEIAVAAIKQGAFDFIEKPFNIDQLIVVIRRAMEVANLRSENTALRSQYHQPLELIGQSAVYKTLKNNLDKVTKSNGRVLLAGPSGVGKETAARYIHCNSNRADMPLVMVNCASLDGETADAKLFGVEFGAKPLQVGLLESAHNGILFFDEIADLPLAVQSKLLRVLVDQSFTRVDGRIAQKVDIRVISATARDLGQEIEAGTFREELFHRLNVVPITVPSLEERREDIIALAEHFLVEFHEKLGLPKRVLSEDAATTLESMTWPGNIRQLKNMVERLLIMGPQNAWIEAEELPSNTGAGDSKDGKIVLSGSVVTYSLREARELFEREYLLTQINRFGGNISRTASFVGMERSALHRKLKSLGVVTSNRSGGRAVSLDD